MLARHDRVTLMEQAARPMRLGDAYLESVELNIGISMCKPLDEGLDSGLGAIFVAGHAVADLHDGGPILRGEVLVRRLCYNSPSEISKQFGL